MDNPAADEEIVSGPDLEVLASHRPGGHALKAVDCLFPVAMMVRRRNARVWWDYHLKHVKRPASIMLRLQKPQLHGSKSDELKHVAAPLFYAT
jgi:hypothetical protein